MSKIKNVYLFYSIIILISFTFAVRASNNAFMTTLPLFVKEYFNFSQVDIGILAGFSSLITFLTSLLINSKINSSARRRLFIFANLLISISFLLIIFSTTASIWFYVLFISFAAGIIMPNMLTSAGDYEDRKTRERMLGIYTLALSASLIVGPTIEALALEHFPLKYAFLVFVPISLMALILSPFMKFPESKTEESKDIKVLSNPGFKVAVYSILTYNAPFSMIVFFSGIFAEQTLKLPYDTIMLLFSLLFAVSFISRVLLSYIVPSRLWRYIKFSMLMTILGLSIIFISRNAAVYAIGIIFLGVPHGLTYPLSISSIGRSFDINKRNKANSYFFAVIMLINIGVPALAGGLIQAIGFRNVMVLIVPVIIVLFFLARSQVKKINFNRLHQIK